MRKKIVVVAIGILSLVPSLHAQKKQNDIVRTEVPGEIVVCFRSGAEPVDVNQTARQWNLPAVDGVAPFSGGQAILHWQHPGDAFFTNVVLMQCAPGFDSATLMRQLGSIKGVEWVAPNYAYSGNVMELIPNDPEYVNQYHHPLMQNNLAWDITMGNPSIIIAVTDNGIARTHADLAANMWVNAGETPGNMTDDDGNGKTDDVNGWDFASNNNDPTPNTLSETHGTHVAGIAAGATNNSIGIAGTAGGCRVMNVQFYSDTVTWTSTIIANAFAYAVNNGAKIISTSYNIDSFVGDATLIAAFQNLYDQGVLHLNSAGNNNQLNPPRQAFTQTLLVASTGTTDVKSSFSNYGTGIDIAAPGDNILSTLPTGTGYGTLSGTSMATPNAAGVAALIWSAHLGWSRDQVAAQLYATANNINAQNPAYVGLLGGGRVNSFQGVTVASLPAPRITSAPGLPAADGGSITNLSGGIKVRFNQIMAPASVNTPGALSLLYAGTDGVFGNGDDAAVPISVAVYRIGSNEASIPAPAGPLACGRYRLTADAAILENPFGTNLDGDGNGSAGDSWQRTFTIEPCAGDVTCDNFVNVNDLLSVIGAWGNSPGGRQDLNNDGTVNVNDLLGVIAAWGSCVPPPPPAIAGDNCASPIVIAVGAHAFSTVGATTAGPTPTSCTTNFGNDIWYRFTPAATGTANVNTCTASSFDSYLLAYSGACEGLTQITCNDDFCSGTRAQITFPVVLGVPVLIRLGGWSSQQGTGTLTISVAP